MVRADRPTESAEDRQALSPESLVREHMAMVLAVCLGKTPSVHDAEDAMQDVFVKAIRNVNTLRDPQRVRGWLVQIARRVCVDRHRKKRPTQPLHPNIPAPQPADGEEIARLQTAIAGIPKQYREVICMYYLDGRNCGRVAESLGVSESTVRQRLCRGRLMLHDLLVKEQP